MNLGKTEVLQNISFSIEKGRTLTVVGPSGCGKSTLLNVLSGIIKQYEGEIYMGEAKLRDAGLTFGYVPQNLGLLPWKKVKDNILLPFSIDKESKLDKHELEDVLNKLELEEGKFFVVSAFSALDTLTADTSRELFLDLWRKYQPTTIFTTHNLSEAVKLGEHILLLDKQPASVLRFVKNPLFESPQQQNEADFNQFKRQLTAWIREGKENSYSESANEGYE